MKLGNECQILRHEVPSASIHNHEAVVVSAPHVAKCASILLKTLANQVKYVCHNLWIQSCSLSTITQ